MIQCTNKWISGGDLFISEVYLICGISDHSEKRASVYLIIATDNYKMYTGNVGIAVIGGKFRVSAFVYFVF
jgi:hypothetical protein